MLRRGATESLIAHLDDLSVGAIFRLWLWVILCFAVLYWAAAALGSSALRAGGAPVDASVRGFGEALYFSFVTALSIGYGDVVPLGLIRVLAILEGIAGLLIFGVLISKLVSRRQEQLTEEIHRITFEDRLGRVRTNLHLVLTEFLSIAASCRERSYEPGRFVPRIESAAAVFVGELRTVHDLLYRPQQSPDEEVMEGILASLAAVLRELADLVPRLPAERRSPMLGSNLRSVKTLADEICGECVPRAYAPRLKSWMDHIQELARTVG